MEPSESRPSPPTEHGMQWYRSPEPSAPAPAPAPAAASADADETDFPALEIPAWFDFRNISRRRRNGTFVQLGSKLDDLELFQHPGNDHYNSNAGDQNVLQQPICRQTRSIPAHRPSQRTTSPSQLAMLEIETIFNNHYEEKAKVNALVAGAPERLAAEIEKIERQRSIQLQQKLEEYLAEGIANEESSWARKPLASLWHTHCVGFVSRCLVTQRHHSETSAIKLRIADTAREMSQDSLDRLRKEFEMHLCNHFHKFRDHFMTMTTTKEKAVAAWVGFADQNMPSSEVAVALHLNRFRLKQDSSKPLAQIPT